MKYPKDFVNKIIQGDFFEVIKNIPDKSIDLLVTDPPYQQQLSGGGTLAKRFDYRRKELESISEFNPMEFLKVIKPKLKYFHAYIWTSKNILDEYIKFAKDNGYNWDILVWVKNNPVPSFNNSYLADLEFCVFMREPGKCFWQNGLGYQNYKKGMLDNVAKNEHGHPTQKYLWMIEKMIKISSQENDLIIDPFLGVGTTTLACRNLHRNFIGIEKEEKYCESARRRLSQQVLI